MSQELQADKGWRIWWKLTRPHTLTASFAPVFLGTMIALYYVNIDWLLFLAMLIACLFIQAATNMFNEYYDFVRGLDSEESIGIGGAIVRNGVKPKIVLQLALALYILAAILGIYICSQSSWLLLIVGAVCMLIGYLYTGGPYPIAYTPFGELFSGVVMGMFIVLIATYIQVGSIPNFALFLSIPSTLLVAAIMLSNNIRDIVEDTKGGRKTMAILIGRDSAINVLALFFIVSYVWIILLVILQIITPWALLVLLSAKKPLDAIKLFKAKENHLEVGLAMKNTALTNTIFVFLLGIGLLLGFII
ncbi:MULTISPECIES: 1,4-dihydroxy-2-naphthoate polyprenyltransferase [Psychrobacillus]|uniref:1,4-dihydroxy-2-naphthoate octaprenyltransferase n=1 Tax=Psychrobacillus faecigallinarum TaxID=2762235 RepID=A0ABR8R6I8_9BACI|nr:1,4-dihydroxy-2-naphthoate polyprenyltransferase [Psychrobacillus faecigallinarum]MBD7943411.1 1,4-dihydroxy-2-naphthoate polyprenyltransferase [Psychrobacillus faecigallinarum]